MTKSDLGEADAFVRRWQAVAGSEISNSQTFIIELCDLLGVERPYTTAERDYMFERPVTFLNADGSVTERRIDCYRRGCFVWESKKIDLGAAHARTGKLAPSFDAKMMLAHSQAQEYARAVTDGRPPFLVVVDVGHVIELYAEFSRSGATYTPFPDARSHRIRIADLAQPDVLERLRCLWTDPLSLDPARASAKVTREVAAELAELAKSLEAAGHAPEAAAAFLTRCLFSMFAEDVGLLPATEGGTDEGEGSFLNLLRRHRDKPGALAKMMQIFWAAMDSGGFNAAIAQEVLKFNGKLFKGASADDYVLPLTPTQIDGLMRAARANWREVEPAIFGTLLERALNPSERHALGAHYTPRAYVERLVLPTVIEPLRADWANAQAAALLLVQEAEALDDARKRDAKLEEARAEIRRFHHQLCSTRVLDPACGSGNFLYVTLEHLKRLEGEVLNQLDALGDRRGKLDLAGETVTVQQLRGIELNGRAAALAELVLWIGWLQWHIRTTGSVANVAEPVVHDYGNIEHRDAVLAYDGMDVAMDAAGRPITRWDGASFKTHPVTGEQVPDEAAQTVQWTYRNPRQASWPEVDFIVGNPPFIGAGPLRAALGDGYAQTLRSSWPEVPESADFVMYWWNHAAALVRAGRVRRFGFITTNSLRQTFNRRVIETHLSAPKDPLTLAFAVPDHPWVDSGAQGAAVRIAMSVGTTTHAGEEGRLLTVGEERATGNEEVDVRLDERRGLLHADLRVGANVAGALPLAANARISSRGVQLFGAGFIVDRTEATSLGLGTMHGLEKHIREYRNGRDLTASPRDVLVIDLFGLSVEQVRERYPAVFQHLLEHVKPERDQNNRATYRDNWWVFGEPRRAFRPALLALPRFIATVETSKHRTFQFLDASVLPDNKLIAIALDDALHQGVLSSQIHVDWSLAAGSWLGIGNDPVYVKTRCFETFPFPDSDTGLTPALADHIRALAEQLDAHRKARQAAHQKTVTLTGMYNVLAALRRGVPLSAKDKLMHSEALVSVLQSLHDELDAAVLQAYGWSDLGAVPWADEAAHQAWTEALLERLVALNTRRAAEEAQGMVRWLRPAFQHPSVAAAAAATTAPELQQTEIDTPDQDDAEPSDSPGAAKPISSAKQPWPATLPAQMKAVADALGSAPGLLTEADLSERFSGRGPWKKRLPQILETLSALGRAHAVEAGWRRSG
jgi:hypothetical protein